MELTFRRQKALLRVRQDVGTEETADGKVVRVFMRQYQGANPQLLLNGTVEGGMLRVVVEGSGRLEPADSLERGGHRALSPAARFRETQAAAGGALHVPHL